MTIRYTTPTLELRIEGIDLTECELLVTFSQGTQRLDVTPSNVTYDGSTHILVDLSQEQTAMFFDGPVNAQVNWIDVAGNRDATKIASLEWHGNLLNRVVHHGQAL